MKIFDFTDWGVFSFNLDEDKYMTRTGFWFGISSWITWAVTFILFWIVNDSRSNHYMKMSLIEILFHDFCVLIFVLSSIYNYMRGLKIYGESRYCIVYDEKTIFFSTLFFFVQLVGLFAFFFFYLYISHIIWSVRYFK